MRCASEGGGIRRFEVRTYATRRGNGPSGDAWLRWRAITPVRRGSRGEDTAERRGFRLFGTLRRITKLFSLP